MHVISGDSGTWAQGQALGPGHGPMPMRPGAKALAHKYFDIWAHKDFDIWAYEYFDIWARKYFQHTGFLAHGI